MADLSWMAWTWQTAVFFALLALALAGMTLLAVRRPESPRVGILRFPTTRGDRLFVLNHTGNPVTVAGTTVDGGGAAVVRGG